MLYQLSYTREACILAAPRAPASPSILPKRPIPTPRGTHAGRVASGVSFPEAWPRRMSQRPGRTDAHGLSSARIRGSTSSGSGYLPSIDFVNTISPLRWTSKIPFAPVTTSISVRRSSCSSRSRATRLAAFVLAPQGTQYSIRILCRSAIQRF